MKKINTSLLSLFFANLFPIFGIFFLHWDLSNMLFLYWFENVVIGFYTILKIKKTKSARKNEGILFFIFQYGMFTFAHGAFLLTLLANNYYSIDLSLLLGIGLLFVSHGVSYSTNFIGKKEYEVQTLEKLMFSPYKRLVVMHLSIILGVTLLLTINDQSIGPLIALVIAKTIVDFFSHAFEHNKLIPIGDNSQQSKVYYVDPSLIRKIFPNYESFVAKAFEKSVESGQWEKIKTQMDPKIAEDIENYWLKNKK